MNVGNFMARHKEKKTKEELNEFIEASYCLESQYMDAVRSGNYTKAAKIKKQLTENAITMRNDEDSLELKRMGYAVNRAMTRIAAYEAGVPATIIHEITTRESATILYATKESQMEKASLKMLKEFCEIIHSVKNSSYSAMVQSVMYSITQNFAGDISVNQISQELGVSESYMISQFKKETGTTPAVYLRNVRLKNATNLLISTDEEIQTICGQVGIQDANYFVKLFKAEYGLTPKAYRKKYRI